MQNREIYVKNPLEQHLLNNGVAEVSEDRSKEAMKVLRYELETFVCSGKYAAGMDKILRTFLTNLDSATEQPGVWISGFYGSGKSHLAKMLRALWVDIQFEDGVSARGIPHLTADIEDSLVELSTQGKKSGGLHAASGKLGSGAGDNVRLAVLGMIFRSAGLPEKYNQARFVLWLDHEGIREEVEQSLKEAGESLESEIQHLFVSDALHEALLKAKPSMAPSVSELGLLLVKQFPERQDVSNEDMIRAIKDALSKDGEFPLTLVVLDEVQQYIDNDGSRAYKIQEVVETCCKHFGGRLLFVGTGQTAMSGTHSLQKIKGRFTVPVPLEDTDVEEVIRKIILQKKQTAVPEVKQVGQDNLGEIARHLQGTKLEHTKEDEEVMVADYPLLPVRRRFWEKVLHKLDESGTISQLRNQLRVVHEAACATADLPLGNVVAGDFIYDQNATDLLQQGLLSREIYDRIGKLDAGDQEQKLKASLLKLIYLIGKLPTDAMADTGVRATEDALADLLVTDLAAGSNDLRKRIPNLLSDLQDKDGVIMAMKTPAGIEYHLQTTESSAWQAEFRRQESELSASTSREVMEREELFRAAFAEAARKVRLTQGDTRETRQASVLFDDSLPADGDTRIYFWLRDGWSSSEAEVVGDAKNAGPKSPTVFVFLPAQQRNELRSAIIERKAAGLTLDGKGIPSTADGQNARAAMETRKNDADTRVRTLVASAFANTLVFQGGGQRVEAGSLSEKLQEAGQAAVARLYTEFLPADQSGWDKVYDRAKKGDAQALQALGHKDEVDRHPVCADILKMLGGGKKGQELRTLFGGPPYGWSQDAIDGALYALVTSGHVLAKNPTGRQIDSKELDRKQLTQATFEPETVTVTPSQKIQVRKIFQEAGVDCQPGQELERSGNLLAELRQLAQNAGGDAPLPELPDQSKLDLLESLAGNALLAELFTQRDDLIENIGQWKLTGAAIAKKQSSWTLLNDLLHHARDLGPYEQLATEGKAIETQRALLASHDPVAALLKKAEDLLRKSLNHHVDAYNDSLKKGHADLKKDNDWKKLDPKQQKDILAKHGLSEEAAINTSSAENIIEELETRSLTHWGDKEKAIPGRVEAARFEAAQLLMPKTVRVELPKRTLSDDDELKQWLEDAEQRIRDKLKDGPVMV